MKSQADYRSVQRLDLMPSPEQRGVCHLQALRGEGFVLRQEVCHFSHVKLLDRPPQVFQQRSEHRRDGWNLAQSVKPLQQDLFAHGRGCHIALTPGSERSAFT